jgi:hypothetical protein
VHQNPAFSQYVDLYVTADSAVVSTPALQLAVAGGGGILVPLVTVSPGIYRGNYQFAGSGTITLTASGLDPGGNTLATQRMFQATLLKRGIGQTIVSPGGELWVSVPAGALAEDTYFTMVPGESAEGNVLSRTYTIGPGREFGSELTVSMRYSPEIVERGKEALLSIARGSGSDWVPLKSEVDIQNRTVSAHVRSLGAFALLAGGGASRVLPGTYALDQNYPNPFNPVTVIEYALHEPARALLRVYDLSGREVATLVDGDRIAGRYRVSWDGRQGGGIPVASGVYVYRLSVLQQGKTAYESARKMLLVR